ncbi:MAG: type V CRISPR-associated protein Cas12b, partial [Thermodesulfobacteriota bacterium]
GTGSNDRLHSVWAGRWEQDNRAWRERLRSARKWVVRRGSKATDKSIRRVGGLSLRRIATIRGLYQIQKAYAMQPKPDDLRANIPVKGDESMQEFGRKTLTAMERMRENRVKQIVSRVVEAALGIGAEKDGKSGKSLPRPKEPINAPCHVIVIENLRDYRPDEIRLRRENRQLMTWSAGKIRERLEEACNLYGLSLRQVSAAYTSRQDSRTGKPGMRCEDISISDFVKGSGYLGKRIARACQAAKEGNGKAEDYLLAELYARWNEKEGTWTDLVGVKWLLGRDARWSKENAPCAKALSHVSPHPVRIPQRGGSIFVSAHQDSPAARGIQADLNAAANIGLRALMDPDWPGRWWYVPCHPSSFLPVTEKIKGCSAIDQLTPLRTDSKSRNDRQIVNLWRDPSTRPAQGGDRTDEWKPTGEYWEDVMKHVIENLRRQAGLT